MLIGMTSSQHFVLLEHMMYYLILMQQLSYTGPGSGCVLKWSMHDEKQSIKRVDVPSP